jgi:hypothetical protein
MLAAGEIAAAVYNTNRSSSSDPVVSAADFIPKPYSEISQRDDEIEESELDIDTVAEFFGVRERANAQGGK